MLSFLFSIVLLVLGYILYGRLVARIFGADANRTTPAIANPDGVDYVDMPWW